MEMLLPGNKAVARGTYEHGGDHIEVRPARLPSHPDAHGSVFVGVFGVAPWPFSDSSAAWRASKAGCARLGDRASGRMPRIGENPTLTLNASLTMC